MIDCAKEAFKIEMCEAGEWWEIDGAENLTDALNLASGYANHLDNEERIRIVDQSGAILI